MTCDGQAYLCLLLRPVPRLVELIDSIIETSYGPRTSSHSDRLSKIASFIENNYASDQYRSHNHWESSERKKIHDIDTLIETNYGKRNAEAAEAAEKPAYATYGLEHED